MSPNCVVNLIGLFRLLRVLEQHKVRWVVQNGVYMAPGGLHASRLLHQIVEINTKLSKSEN